MSSSSSSSLSKRISGLDDERPAKRQRMDVVDLVTKADEEVPAAMEAARKAHATAVRDRDAVIAAIVDMEKAWWKTYDKEHKKFAATRKKLRTDIDEQYTALHKQNDICYEADRSLRNIEWHAEAKDRFWTCFYAFFHDGHVHVPCKDHQSDPFRSIVLCFYHPSSFSCNFNCYDWYGGDQPKCPGCFHDAAPGCLNINRRFIKGECDEFEAKHDGDMKVNNYRCLVGSRIDNRSEFVFVGACKECQAKVCSMVEFKNKRVTTLLTFMESTLPRAVSNLASQYLIYTISSCWRCKPVY